MDSYDKLFALVVAAIVVVVIVACGVFTYGSVLNNRTYYAAQAVCVEHGGTWVPTSVDAACVGAKP